MAFKGILYILEDICIGQMKELSQKMSPIMKESSTNFANHLLTIPGQAIVVSSLKFINTNLIIFINAALLATKIFSLSLKSLTWAAILRLSIEVWSLLSWYHFLLLTPNTSFCFPFFLDGPTKSTAESSCFLFSFLSGCLSRNFRNKNVNYSWRPRWLLPYYKYYQAIPWHPSVHQGHIQNT